MQCCQTCGEPAAKRAQSWGRDGRESVVHLCYVHAVEAGLLDAPLDRLRQVAQSTGYPLNAGLFILETLIRGGVTQPSDPDADPALGIASQKTPQEICSLAVSAAAERFGAEAERALEGWQLRRGSDIAAILKGFSRCGVLAPTTDDGESICRGLLAEDAPLSGDA